MVHQLEIELNAPAADILEAIQNGFRALVDVKGKLAELYLYRQLKSIQEAGHIQDVKWIDLDGKPDFEIYYEGNILTIECKNLRNKTYKKPELSYKVEIQRTRNSKDGSNTRSYRVDYFDILAVCMFNQTSKWEFRFTRSRDLACVPDDASLLKIMQRVPIEINSPWTYDLSEILE